RIWVDRDGTVEVNGAVQPVEGLSELLAPLDAETAVVSLEAHQAAAYRVVAAVQEELQAAGRSRVNFTVVASEAQRSSTQDLATLMDAGLQVVLPDASSPDVRIVDIRELAARNPTNILFLEVLSTGMVAVRRGADPREQAISARQVEAVVRQGLAANP